MVTESHVDPVDMPAGSRAIYYVDGSAVMLPGGRYGDEWDNTVLLDTLGWPATMTPEVVRLFLVFAEPLLALNGFSFMGWVSKYVQQVGVPVRASVYRRTWWGADKRGQAGTLVAEEALFQPDSMWWDSDGHGRAIELRLFCLDYFVHTSDTPEGLDRDAPWIGLYREMGLGWPQEVYSRDLPTLLESGRAYAATGDFDGVVMVRRGAGGLAKAWYPVSMPPSPDNAST